VCPHQKFPRRLLIAVLLATAIPVVHAQDYPNKPIRMIVGFPPGGGADIVARLVAAPFGEHLATQIVIDNRPGAGSSTGTGVAAKSAADGYTLLFSTTGFTINPNLYKSVPYHPVKDFAPIAQVGSSPFVLVVLNTLPVITLQEFIALARARPGSLNYSTGGNGSTGHLSGELLKSMAKIEIQHVPYRGLAPALADLLGGRVQMTMSSLPSCINYMKAGRMKALAVTTAKRFPQIPDIPTMSESGLSGYNVDQWYGLLTPAGTPGPVVQTLHRTLAGFLQKPDPQLIEQFAVLGIVPAVTTPQEFTAMIKSDLALWAKVVKESGARVD
jgi:tripartite-type tricarboxylate transporter receptor subunit TctC